MKILSVFDSEFKPYGKVVTGLDEMVHSIVAALANTPLPEGVGYVPEEPLLQQLPEVRGRRHGRFLFPVHPRPGSAAPADAIAGKFFIIARQEISVNGTSYLRYPARLCCDRSGTPGCS